MISHGGYRSRSGYLRLREGDREGGKEALLSRNRLGFRRVALLRNGSRRRLSQWTVYNLCGPESMVLCAVVLNPEVKNFTSTGDNVGVRSCVLHVDPRKVETSVLLYRSLSLVCSSYRPVGLRSGPSRSVSGREGRSLRLQLLS